MRTQDLIRALAADEIETRPVERVLPLALIGTTAALGVLFYAIMGVRPDLEAAFHRLPVILKQAFPIMAAVAAFGATLRLARPEARLDGWAWGLLLAPAVVIASFWTTALSTPASAWASAIAGHSIATCLTFIPVIGAPVCLVTLFALRRGASTRPRATGAAAGLLGGSAAAAVYAVYCTDDSPMFWGVWYVLAIALVAGLGALLGPRFLRW